MLNDTIIIIESELNSKIDNEIQGVTNEHDKDMIAVNQKIVSLQCKAKGIKLLDKLFNVSKILLNI